LFRAGGRTADGVGERPRAAADKGEDAADQRVARTSSLDPRQPVAKYAAAKKQVPISFAQPQNLQPGKAAPAQADHVDADEGCPRSVGHATRNDVGANAADPDDHRALPDPHELADCSLAAEKAVVADADMAADHGIVGEGDVAADLAVMGHVGAGHEKT